MVRTSTAYIYMRYMYLYILRTYLYLSHLGLPSNAADPWIQAQAGVETNASKQPVAFHQAIFLGCTVSMCVSDRVQNFKNVRPLSLMLFSSRTSSRNESGKPQRIYLVEINMRKGGGDEMSRYI
jgi:hypothetical protein